MADEISNIKIHELDTASNLKDDDFLVRDVKDSGILNTYTTFKMTAGNVKNYIFRDNESREVSFSTVSGSVNALKSGNSVLVKTMTSPDDSSNNAASTEWVTKFWEQKLSSAVTVTQKWTFSGGIDFGLAGTGKIITTSENGKLKNTTIESTQLEYWLNGLDTTKTVASMLDDKVSKNNLVLSSPKIEGTIKTDLTGNRALATDASGNIIASSISSDELAKLAGIGNKTVKSQLDDKADASALSDKADDNKVIHNHGDEEGIGGVKKFTSCIHAKTPDANVADTHLITAEWIVNKGFATQSWVSDQNYVTHETYDPHVVTFNSHTGNSKIHAPSTAGNANDVLTYNGTKTVWTAPYWVTTTNFNAHANDTNAYKHLPTINSDAIGKKLAVMEVNNTLKPVWQNIASVPEPETANLVLTSTSSRGVTWAAQAAGTRLVAGTNITLAGNSSYYDIATGKTYYYGDVVVNSKVPVPSSSGKYLTSGESGAMSWGSGPSVPIKSISASSTGTVTVSQPDANGNVVIGGGGSTGGISSVQGDGVITTASESSGTVTVKLIGPTSFSDKYKILKAKKSQTYPFPTEFTWGDEPTVTSPAIFIGGNITSGQIYKANQTQYQTRTIYTTTQNCFVNINVTINDLGSNSNFKLYVGDWLVQQIYDSDFGSAEHISWSGFVKAGKAITLTNCANETKATAAFYTAYSLTS